VITLRPGAGRRCGRGRRARPARGRAVGALLLIAVGVGLGLVAVRWWVADHDLPAAPAARPAAHSPPVSTTAPWTPPPSSTPVAPPAVPAGLVRAALARRLRGGALPRELVDLIVAGDLARAAARLAAAKGPGSAALEWDLLALCHEATEAGATPGAEDERAARAAVELRPDLAAVLQPMIEARHAFDLRLGAGCRSVRLDPESLQRRLAASAASGDAASLERMATVDAAPAARLQSAALLGAPRAQFRLALSLLEDRPAAARTPEQRLAGLSWLQAAAKGDADAQSYYGSCLLDGCPGAPDPPAARAALESAARRGSSQALGLLSAGGGGEPPNDWSGTLDVIAPLPPRGLDSLGLDAAEHYAWAALAERLARDGCFGFAFLTTAQALAAPARLERTLRPAELAEARELSTRLWSETGEATRHALSCD
jgi:hypothetical protein